MYPRLLQIGHLALPTSGLFTALAIIGALFTASAAARTLTLNAARVWDICVAGVLAALLAPRLLQIALNWNDFRAHPLWLLGVVSVRSQPAWLGGLAIAVGVMALYGHLAGLPLYRTLDAFAPALALGGALWRMGTFFSGSGYGTPTRLPWGIIYTSRLASLWNGTPLGVPLHPVQLYKSAAEVALLALATAMIVLRKELAFSDGRILGAWLLLHGFTDFLLDLLQAGFVGRPLSHLADGAMVLAGGLLWLRD